VNLEMPSLNVSRSIHYGSHLIQIAFPCKVVLGQRPGVFFDGSDLVLTSRDQSSDGSTGKRGNETIHVESGSAGKRERP
jgi:hypothetical protein